MPGLARRELGVPKDSVDKFLSKVHKLAVSKVEDIVGCRRQLEFSRQHSLACPDS